MMVGDKMKYNTAVVTLQCEGQTDNEPGTDVLTAEASKVDPACKTVKDAMASEIWKKHIDTARATVNADHTVCISNVCKIQKIAILPIDFSVAGDELTPTLKLKRSTVMKKYDDLIMGMY